MVAIRGQSVTYSPSFKMKLSLSLVAFITLQVVIGIPVPADNPCAGFSKLVISEMPFSLMQTRVLFHLVIDPITKLGNPKLPLCWNCTKSFCRSAAMSTQAQSCFRAWNKAAAETDADHIVVFECRIGPEKSVAASVAALEVIVARQPAAPTAKGISALLQ